jgi:chemotaxis protein methyltransferase CheR
MLSSVLDDQGEKRSGASHPRPSHGEVRGEQPFLLHVRLKDREFRLLSSFITQETGIKMPPAKRTMLEARLQKRLKVHRMRSFGEYVDYVFSPEGTRDELVHMLDTVTTNKTDFFREPAHYRYLTERALPRLIRERELKRPLRVWSAGCSSGEEPYTLAIVLNEFKENNGGFDFSVLATDLSSRVLEKARRAVYEERKLEFVPEELKRKYFLRSKDRDRGLVRVIGELREKVLVRRLNFMAEDYELSEQMDVIFCRNVIIYFDRPQQEKLINRFCRHLQPGGYIFVGHSETLNGLPVPVEQEEPTVYRKRP